MRRALPFAFLLLAGCPGPETGIDGTLIHGTLVIPPATVAELDRAGTDNDSPGAAQGLGQDGSSGLTYRAVVVTGSLAAFGVTVQGDYEDADFYAFTPAADGDFTFWLAFDAGGAATSKGFTDGVTYQVAIVDLGAYDGTEGIVWSGSTDGSAGAFSTVVPVTGGTEYAVFLYGDHSDAGDSSDYTLTLSGSAPAEGTVLVGLYEEPDPTVAKSPVGGSSATGWVFDQASLTWSGTFDAYGARTVAYAEDPDTADNVPPDILVNEDLSTVYVNAATKATLNRTPSAGSLYSTQSLAVDLTHGELTLAAPIVLDGVFPKVIGQVVAEATPDTTNAEPVFDDKVGVYRLDAKTLSVQDVGMLSGLGYVDVFDGAIELSGTDGWNGANDSDAFMFTVPESMGVSMVASWPDASADIDFGIWGDYEPYGQLEYFSTFSDSYCLTGSDPEVCETVVTLEPDITYYLVALGYAGTGTQDYHIELEWTAP